MAAELPPHRLGINQRIYMRERRKRVRKKPTIGPFV